jgi:hypothetical protein
MKIEGYGSISQTHESADPDPDPHQNFMDPQHWKEPHASCLPVVGRKVAKVDQSGSLHVGPAAAPQPDNAALPHYLPKQIA